MLQKPPVKCPVCYSTPIGNKNFIFIEDFQSIDGKFSLFECPYCQVQFWMPFQAPDSNYYEKQEIENLKRKSTAQLADIKTIKRKATIQWYTKQFLKHPPHKNTVGKKLLDVGCGTGELILKAQDVGYEVYGIDFDKEQINIAKQYGLNNVYCDDLFNFLKYEKNKYGVITGFEILEHLDKPKKFIELCYQAVKHNGYIVLSTPNRLRAYGKIENQIGDFPLHHFTRWTADALKTLLESCNFTVLKVKKQLPLDFFVEKFRFNIGFTLRKILKPNQERKYTTVDNRKAGKKIKIYKLDNDFIFSVGYYKDQIIKFIFFIPAYIWAKHGYWGVNLYLLGKKK
jgi:2-polyprenyl-3-methyl-5-hydroxy-6-metoxy-1,4-benzoquinol methylase